MLKIIVALHPVLAHRKPTRLVAIGCLYKWRLSSLMNVNGLTSERNGVGML